MNTCEAFFQQGIYSHDYVDFCIEASGNTLGENICIFQKETYKVMMRSIKCNKFVSIIDNMDCHYNPYVKSQYLKTHKEEIGSRFVLSPEEEAEHNSWKVNQKQIDGAQVVNSTLMDSLMESTFENTDAGLLVMTLNVTQLSPQVICPIWIPVVGLNILSQVKAFLWEGKWNLDFAPCKTEIGNKWHAFSKPCWNILSFSFFVT